MDHVSEGAAGVDGLISPASFGFPDAVIESAWLQHAPFAFWLMEMLQPRTFVELGAHHGFSYLSFCQAASQLGLAAKGYAVDTWQGDEHAGFYDDAVFETLAAYHDPRYGHFSRLVRSTFDDALPHFADGSIDLLHIDGRHFYDDVKHDFESWKNKLSNRAIVLLHDTNVRERGFGVPKLWEELQQQYPAFEFLHGHGLGVLGIGTELSPELNRLFDASTNPGLCARIRGIYARLGSAIEERHLRAKQETALRTSANELVNLRAKQETALRTSADELVNLRRQSETTQQHLLEQEANLSSVREAHQAAEHDLAVALAQMQTQLNDMQKRSESSRWLLRAMAQKAVRVPRDILRRMRRSWRKRRAGGGSGRKYLSSWMILRLKPVLSRSFAMRMRKRMDKHAPPETLLSPSIQRTPNQSNRPSLFANGGGDVFQMPQVKRHGTNGSRQPKEKNISSTNFRSTLDNENFLWYLSPELQFNPSNTSIVYFSGEPNSPGETYRVINYVEALRLADISAYWVRPQDAAACRHQILTADLLIIWRHIFTDELEKIVLQRRLQSKLTIYDTDDLMIVPEIANSKYIDAIRFDKLNANGVTKFYALHQKMLAICDAGFASTETLANAMRKIGKLAFVVPNGFGTHILKHSLIGLSELRYTKSASQPLRIGYSSGSRTHQKDFACAASAVAAVMRKYPQVILTTFGPTLDLSEFPEFADLKDRIEMRSLMELDYLPYETARFDINISPLEVGNIFCESKSELKYFEAALVGVPTIASPTAPFQKAITHGVNGMLAESEDDWLACLERLITDAHFRNSLARNAAARAYSDFGPEAQMRAAIPAIEDLLGGRSPVQGVQPAGAYPAVQLAPHRVISARPGDKAGDAAVVIPLYNYSSYIEECLDSVKRQVNGAQLDVIVVDDCSTDESVVRASDWLSSNGASFRSWILLQHEKNCGLAETRNLGVSYCPSSYYFALDADNKLEPDCVEQCLQKFKTLDGHKTLGAVYPARRLFGETTNLFKNTNMLVDVGKWDPERLSKGNYIDAMALIRKSAWRRVGGYTVVKYVGGWEDYDFWCKFVECGLFAEYEPNAIAHYRTHKASMLHQHTHSKNVFPALAATFQENHPWVSLGRSA